MKPILYVRGVIASIIFLLATGYYGILVIMFAGNDRLFEWAARRWGSVTLWAFNMHVRVEGEQNIPPGGCLFLFNHSSHLDIITIYAKLRKGARFGAKIELFKIPLFGTIMRAGGMLPIVRSDRAGVLELYEKSIARVKNGESFLLAAEGTRQLVPGVGPKFKAGPAIFAISGQFPIVPLVIKGAAECLPKNTILACTDKWRHDLTLKILPPVPTAGLVLEDRPRLLEDLRERMTKAYDQIDSGAPQS